jgi:exopolyphosphatase/guanosine-5'-triphosphate,3'-diphosphate pyrophosphatase
MNTLLQESRELRARYDEEPSHSDQVAVLALQLFDGLRPWHALGERPRQLLHSAALLHDIGWSQTPDGKGHHKWSARLIREHGWKSLEVEEIVFVALTARYHRKTVPRPEHEPFHALPAAGQKLVLVLGGILRLADALDRTHSGRIGKTVVSVGKNLLLVQVQPRGKWDAERAMFATKRDMLELAAERSVRCEELE